MAGGARATRPLLVRFRPRTARPISGRGRMWLRGVAPRVSSGRPARGPSSPMGAPDFIARQRRVLVIAGVLAILFLAGLLPRIVLWRRLDQQAQMVRETLPQVSTTQPQRAAAVVDVPLPGPT